jgi:two-component system sensor histidine kinase KdpD
MRRLGNTLATLRRRLRPWAGVASPRAGRDAWKSYAVATLLVACVTIVGFVWVEMPDPRNLSLLFFGAILLAGVLLGMRPALYAAVLACLSTNYFLVEPRFTLKFALADYLALVTFAAGGSAGLLNDSRSVRETRPTACGI